MNMVETEGGLTQMLVDLGLTENHAKVILALYKNPSPDAQRLAPEANIPLAKIYAIIHDLEKLGIIQTTLGRPKRYNVIEPELVANALVRAKESEINGLRKHVGKVISSLNTFVKGSSMAPEENVMLLPNFESIWNLTHRYVKGIKKVNNSIGDEWTWRYAFNDVKLAEACAKALSRNATFKWIAPESLNRLDTIPSAWLKVVSHENTSIRFLHATKIFHNIMTMDSTEASLSFVSPKTGETCGGINITNPATVAGIINYFDMIWATATLAEDQIRAAARAELARREKETKVKKK